MATQQSLEQIRNARLEKLNKLKKLNINPFPSLLSRERVSISTARELPEDSCVFVAGRIFSQRGHGGIQFWDLQDFSGSIQLCVKKDCLSATLLELIDLCDIGDYIGAGGKIFVTKAGELSILIDHLELLTKTLRPLPSQHYGLCDTEECYRKRYLDLLTNPETRKVFKIRTQVVSLLRQHLDLAGFVEVDTPVLQPIYGGASAKPFVTHHNALDIDLYLRISDELYLKRLLVGGFEKVYEIGHDFRNEGIDRQHNPEFTMLEFYWAYADYEDLMSFTEKMLTDIIKQVIGSLKIKYGEIELDFTPPWPRVTYRDLLIKYTQIDINIAADEASLRKAISEIGLKFSTEDLIGYGAILDALYKEFVRPNLVQPMYLLDYPAQLIALAKRKDDDLTKIASFQLLVAGFEILKAYNELNDPLDQRARWEESEKLGKLGQEEHEPLDEDYIEALEYGMPPTAGWGMGIDRFVSIITNSSTLKDTILFPTMRPKEC